LEAQVHKKDVLKCFTIESGEPCVVIFLMTQQQELFATCSGMVTSDIFFLTSTVPVGDRFGWTTFNAMEQKLTLQIVNTTAGVFITVFMVKTFQFLASQ